MRILALALMLAATPLLASPALAAEVTVDEADALMDEARACSKTDDQQCVFDRMHTVLSSGAVLEALAKQQMASYYWFGYYKTAITLIDNAGSADAIAQADRAIALIEANFPEQDDAAMVFHMMRAEAYADLGDLEAGKDSAAKALDGFMQVALIGNNSNALMSADDVTERLAQLQVKYKGVL